MKTFARKIYEFGQFRVDAVERLLFDGANTISLTPKAFDTLLLLIENSGHTLTKEEMMSEIWAGAFVEENNLAQNVSILRKTLGEGVIETVPKRGYRFVAPVRLFEDDASEPLVIHEKIRARVLIDDDAWERRGDEILNLNLENQI